ncbi:hypothetical protein F4804DRAFT_312724 [Jackrogersella minutella]|nr:hypothetical protein F4804DRAFT_312724 [Jackrogersella minutella]
MRRWQRIILFLFFLFQFVSFTLPLLSLSTPSHFIVTFLCQAFPGSLGEGEKNHWHSCGPIEVLGFYHRSMPACCSSNGGIMAECQQVLAFRCEPLRGHVST